MSSLRVIAPGLLTTVQDRGRWGWQSRGVPVAGPMDLRSHRIANALVGNDSGSATLEITLTGPSLEFEDQRIAAVAGASFALTVDGRAAALDRPFQIPAGGVLRFGARRRGARSYLAVSGGVAVPPVFGSRSTHLPSGMGGMQGRALRPGDRVPLGRPDQARPSPSRRPKWPFDPSPLPDGEARVRVLAGPQLGRFAADALDVLQSAPYTVDAASNRMGFRLQGPALKHAGSAEMLSDVTTIGALQVAAGGQPMLLMADRQTTGGYPGIATVISADLTVVGQLAPGDSMSFVVTTPREAIAALIAQEQALLGMESGQR